ncbi:radical SAM protein [bacterium]|nr:radical SAM protein [bacterium]
MNINVYKIIEQTEVEGPGKRFCLWVQGCSIHCEGCWATETWDKDKGDKYTVEKIFDKIKAQKDIEGVTFLGGEPFEQAEALGELAQMCKNIGLSVLTFSGNLYENLKAKNDKSIDKLLENTDLLIDGKFDKTSFDLTRPWVGSKNKRYIFLTDRYSENDLKIHKNKIEVRVNKDGSVFVNGMGDFNKILDTFL